METEAVNGGGGGPRGGDDGVDNGLIFFVLDFSPSPLDTARVFGGYGSSTSSSEIRRRSRDVERFVKAGAISVSESSESSLRM